MRNITVILFFCMGLIACGKPKNMPDDVLETIVHDMFLANAYMETDMNNFSRDSLDLYEPIFKKYGYSTKDLLYTVDNLSKRKSVRFTDILDSVAARIEKESGMYDSLVVLRDSTQQRLIRRYRTLVYSSDKQLKAVRVRELDSMSLTIPVSKGGYEVMFSYFVDSADLNSYVQYHQKTVDSSGREANNVFRGYTKGIRKKENVKSTLSQDGLRELVINFARVTGRDPKTPNVTVDSIRIYHSPTLEAAEDSLMYELFVKNMDSILPPNIRVNAKLEKNYVSLPADTARIDAGSDSVVRK